MKSWFAHHGRVDPVPLDDELPGPARRITIADRACCCPARPVVTVVIPAARGRSHPVDLLLCGHHYRVSLAALQDAGADVYDETGALIMTGATGQPPAIRERAAAAALRQVPLLSRVRGDTPGSGHAAGTGRVQPAPGK